MKNNDSRRHRVYAHLRRVNRAICHLYSMSAIVLYSVSVVSIASPAGAEDISALLGKANSAYTVGEYRDCIDYYTAAINQGAKGKDVFYNAACCCALTGDIERAFGFLTSAIENGFHNADWLNQDSDLQSLRGDARWPEIIIKCRTAEEAYLATINQELYRAFQADQGDRMTESDDVDWSRVRQQDAERRQMVMEMLDSGLVTTSDDYFHAAMIFQHGEDTADYLLAHELALKAVDLDSSNGTARWLAAASKDRYLWSAGKPQWYGTQSHMIDGIWTIEPIDTTAVTDEERRRWHVPPLAESRLRTARMNEQNER